MSANSTFERIPMAAPSHNINTNKVVYNNNINWIASACHPIGHNKIPLIGCNPSMVAASNHNNIAAKERTEVPTEVGRCIYIRSPNSQEHMVGSIITTKVTKKPDTVM